VSVGEGGNPQVSKTLRSQCDSDDLRQKIISLPILFYMAVQSFARLNRQVVEKIRERKSKKDEKNCLIFSMTCMQPLEIVRFYFP